MGDAIDDMKAAAVSEKRRRHANWQRRHADAAVLRVAGFDAQPLGADERHWRVKLPGHGLIDFWPATWRWHERRKGEERNCGGGHGLDTMLARLREIPKG